MGRLVLGTPRGQPLPWKSPWRARRNSVRPRGVEHAQQQSVESLCNALARHGLLPPEEVRKLYQRWKNESGDSNVTAFTRWLADNRYLTEYQAAVLGRGHA